MKEFYFSKYENRKPHKAIQDNKWITLGFQFCGILTAILGTWYLWWRWNHSLNPDALWFAVPLIIAETFSFLGTLLMVFNLWSYDDPPKKKPPHYLSDIEELNGREDRPLKIDVFIATYNEDAELVRLSIRDAKKMYYPYRDVDVKVYVLDDGRRDGRDPSKENMLEVAEKEGAFYITRESNEGYKAGNLKNGLEQTDGDIFVILDADTRPFRNFLINTSGYFRDKKVAWVQTPQWFYDTTPAVPLSETLIKKLKIRNDYLKGFLKFSFGWIKTGEDIFGNDPRLFYEVILRKRNFYNASFCCGAGSFHRREAVIGKALKDFAKEINLSTEDKRSRFLESSIKPFKFHASEDIYTSMVMHNDEEKWKSVLHPDIEAKMLSPQDLDSCIKQRARYAQGSLDIAFKDNPFGKKNLTLGQKLCYFNTIWSYFAPLWIIIFLLAPLIFYFTHSLPVNAYSFDFFKHFIPFQILNTITVTLGSWGHETKRGEQYYINSFWLMLKSLYAAAKGDKVKFNVTPKDRQKSNNNIQHIRPHLIIIVLSFTGIIYNMILIAMNTHPSISGFVSNTLWALFNIYNLSVMVAYWEETEDDLPMESTVASQQPLILQPVKSI